MTDILSQIGTKVGSEIKSLDTRLSALEGSDPPVTPPSSFTINPVQWTNLSEINLSGEKLLNTDFDLPTLALGVGVVVLTSWSNGGKTAAVGEVYEIDLVQSNGGMRLTNSSQSIFASASQMQNNVQPNSPENWSLQGSNSLDQSKLAEGIIKGVGASVSINQMFSNPIASGTALVAKVTRNDTNESGTVHVQTLRANGTPFGGNKNITFADGFVEFETTETAYGIRLSTTHGNREVSSISLFQGAASGGTVQVNGNGGLQKIAGADGFNAGASSTNFIEGNSDGYVQFQWGAEFKSQRVGLTYQDVDFENIQPFMLSINGNGRVFVNGANAFGQDNFAVLGDFFRVRHYASDNTIRFQKRQEIFDSENNSLGQDYVTFHTHSNLTNGNNLYVDTSLFHIGSQLNDVLLAR